MYILYTLFLDKAKYPKYHIQLVRGCMIYPNYIPSHDCLFSHRKARWVTWRQLPHQELSWIAQPSVRQTRILRILRSFPSVRPSSQPGVFIRWCFKSPVMGGLETTVSWDAPSWSPAPPRNITATPRNRVFFHRSPRRLHKITLQKTMRMTGSNSKNDQTCWTQISGLQDVANPHVFQHLKPSFSVALMYFSRVPWGNPHILWLIFSHCIPGMVGRLSLFCWWNNINNNL